MKVFGFLFLACLVVYANGDAATNGFLDALLNNIRPFISQKFEPVPLPYLHHVFSKKVWFVDVRGEAWMTNGKMWGLKNIHRVGDTTMKHEGGTLIAKGRAGINGIKGQYNVKASFAGLQPTVVGHVWVHEVKIRMGVKQALESGAHPGLTDFAIEAVNGIGVRIDGLGPLGWIVGGLVQLIGNHLKGPITNAINAPIKNMVREELKKMTIPV